MQLLAIEDSPTLGSLLKSRLTRAVGATVHWVANFAGARAAIEERHVVFDYALVDLNLPDATGMEVIDYVIAAGIPAIVFTGDCSDDTRDLLWSRQIVDYIVKDSGHSIDYVIYLLRRLEANRGVKVLLVDDSSLYRKQLGGLLRSQNLEVIDCASAGEALKALQSIAGIRMVMTDYQMADMNGFELTKTIRKTYPKELLSVVGMSFRGDNVLSSQFLKSGASDFIDKSFTAEQIYCRINQDLENLDLIDNLRQAAIRDYLTGLYNRRYLYEAGKVLVGNARRRNAPVMVAMIDIDYFKRINDTHGHDAGDFVLCRVAEILRDRFRESDIVARFGGEEFCVLAADADASHMTEVMDSVRLEVRETSIEAGGSRISVTVSAGVFVDGEFSLEKMIAEADSRLYAAKASGRDRIVAHPRSTP